MKLNFKNGITFCSVFQSTNDLQAAMVKNGAKRLDSVQPSYAVVSSYFQQLATSVDSKFKGISKEMDLIKQIRDKHKDTFGQDYSAYSKALQLLHSVVIIRAYLLFHHIISPRYLFQLIIYF